MQIVFQLHPSFATPIRELQAPPYELTEHGWGEFEIAATVRILFRALHRPCASLSSRADRLLLNIDPWSRYTLFPQLESSQLSCYTSCACMGMRRLKPRAAKSRYVPLLLLARQARPSSTSHMPTSNRWCLRQVVSETYDELVFSQPFEAFYRSMTAAQPGRAPPLSIADHLLTQAEDHVEELEGLRRRNAQLLATLQERAGGLAY